MEIHKRTFGTTHCQIRTQQFNTNMTVGDAPSWLAEAWLEESGGPGRWAGVRAVGDAPSWLAEAWLEKSGGPVRGPDRRPVRRESSSSEDEALQKMEEYLA